MKCIDESTQHDLAQSSSTLQCVLMILEYQCSIYHTQVEVVGVCQNVATVDLSGMSDREILSACMEVNKQFQRKDGKPTCTPQATGDTFVKCETVALSEYIKLT